MLIPAVTEWQPLAPAGTRPPDFPADLPFIPDVAAEFGTAPTGAVCRWLIPVSAEDAERQRQARAAASEDLLGYFIKGIQGSDQVSTIASAMVNALGEDATSAGWVRVTKPETHWPGMVERRGFTRGDRYLEIWALMFGPEPHVMVTTGPQEK